MHLPSELMRPLLLRKAASSPRPFSTSRARLSRPSFPSPTYPSLFYHPLPTPNTFALSFLPTPAPSLAFSPTTIGVLSPDAVLPSIEDGTGLPTLTPRNFVENQEFVELVHEVLQGVVEADVGMDTMAKVRGDGYMCAPSLYSHSQ